MVFSSLEFIFIFLPAFFIVYGFIPPVYKNAVLFLGSIVFYCMGVLEYPVYIILFLLTIIFNFIIGEFISSFRRASKVWLITGITFNFAWLIFFKYIGFLFENINSIPLINLPMKDIILPIGISFYTFQNVSYIIDVYRRKAHAETSLVNYGAYISMYPQLIAGPIVTYSTVAEQLKQRTHTAEKVDNGLKTFTVGLGLKVILANQIGGLWKDISMIGYESISTPLAWLGLIAYSFQIYFDFWGYSLMAIGLGEIMGFDIPKNFDHPYISVSMTEFWRRWHITLGSWFKDYIYFPLGGSRTTTLKTVRNSFIVWAFTGLWHGASWNFIIWGFVLFGILMLEKFCGVKNFMEKYRIVGHIYMIILIPLSWLLFAITDFSQLGEYFLRLINIRSKDGVVFEHDYIKYWEIYGKYFIVGILFSTKLPELIYKKIKDSYIGIALLLAVFWFSVYCMYQGMDDPFLYFRF